MDDTPAATPIKVLFVDDEDNILRALRRLMAEEDLEVLCANSGEAGLALVQSTENLGLIVSDQRMPGMGGAEFLEQAKVIAPDAIRMVLTGYADIKATMDAINKGGAYRYITKPWDDEEMLRIVREAVGRFTLLRENQRLTALVNQQNEELKDWNAKLKKRVIEQTADIRRKNDEMASANKRLRESFNNTILAFSGLIELRDQEAKDHSKCVADLSTQVAERLGLDPEAVLIVRTAALLHDIGKIGVRDEVLTKDELAWSVAEREEYMMHAIRGQAAIDSIEDLRQEGVLIRHHHERFDGSGFPDKLRGREIPVGSRIIAMADFIDRTIKRLRTDVALELALRGVRERLGACFDPELYPHFEEVSGGICSPRLDLYKTPDMVEQEIDPRALRSGMVILRNVYSGTGLLLVSKDTCLDEAAVRSLWRYFRIDPPTEPVLVLTAKI